MLHRPPSFQRSQDGIGVNRRALEDLIAKRVRQSIQDRSACAPDWRLANTAGAHRSLRVGNIQRFPLHVHWHVENRRRLTMVEPLGDHHSVMWVEDPLLAYGVADAEDRPPQYLAAERA